MYSTYFNGWIGKLDEYWSKEERENLFSSLFSYYHRTITSGQKLFIGFDHNQTSKYMAIQAAEFFSQNGIPVFISNRPLSTSMLQVITKERYGCGALSFVRDDYPFPYIGLKACDIDGKFIKKKDIASVGEFKKQKKQPLDWFDPILNLKNYLETNFGLPETHRSLNSLVWNSMYSPLSPILEELFIDIFNKKGIDAYTINSYENTVTKDIINEFELQEQIDLTMIKMNEFLCHYGVTTSPDLTKIDLLTEKKGKVLAVSFEEIVSRILPYLNLKESIIISDEISFSRSLIKTELEIKKVSEKHFLKSIQNEPFSVAIDGNYNIYLQCELFPNHFAVLFCLYHSLIYVAQDKKPISKLKTSIENKEAKI